MTTIVRLEHVTCDFGGAPVLEDVSLEVQEGDLVGVVGPSGSGKTTLLKLLTGALRPRSGRIVYPDGRPTIGYVPQVETVNWFFPVTVLETVLMAKPSQRRGPRATAEEIARARYLLDQLEIGDLASRHIRALSGGQQQRVFIARALVSDPQLLLLDEPTSGVDVRTRHEVTHILHELHHEGIAILFTTHDLNGVAAHVPEIVCLNRRVIAVGEPRSVLSSEVLERTYGAPMDVLIHGGMPVVVDPGSFRADLLRVRGEHHDHSP